MAGGRPWKFQSVEEMEEKINAYFKACTTRRLMIEGKDVVLTPDDIDALESVTSDAHPTITGLALALDTTRDILIDYESRDGFSNAIKRAKNKIESYNEQRLFGNNVTGVIFNLKNNFGWVDKYENNNTHKIDVIEIQKDFGE